MSTETSDDISPGEKAAREDIAGMAEFFENSNHPLATMYRKRVRQDRDLVILITDSDNDRGTGKTTLALRLAQGMDRTEDGITDNKTALNPHPLIQAYTSEPRGSSLVLDESEVGLDKYKSGSAVNSAIRELVSMGRIEEKYLILNAPADHLVDKDLKSLVDVWILVQDRGHANVYRMGWSAHQGHALTHGMGTIGWSKIRKRTDLYDVYSNLTGEKKSRLSGDEGEDFIKKSEAEDMVENAKKEVRQETRDEIIRKLADMDIAHKKIGKATGIGRSRVSQIVNQI